MAVDQGRSDSQLFTLRVWLEEIGENGQSELRGTLKHVLSGETFHFRDWQTMIGQIETVSGFEKVNTPGGQP